MIKAAITLTVICADLQARVAVQRPSTTAESANQIIDWNRNLLPLQPTAGAQATLMRSLEQHYRFVVHISRISLGVSQGAAGHAPAQKCAPCLRVTTFAFALGGTIHSGSSPDIDQQFINIELPGRRESHKPRNIL